MTIIYETYETMKNEVIWLPFATLFMKEVPVQTPKTI